MSANLLSSIPKLRGRENYDEWAFVAENYLVINSLNKCIDGSEEDATIDSKAKAQLILSIDSSIYVHIKSAKTSKDLWNKLKTLYDDSGYTRKIGLLRCLISTRLENCDYMEGYVNQIIETAQKLQGTGFKIDDEWIGSLLLAGLPEHFSPMIMAIEHSGIQITAGASKPSYWTCVPTLVKQAMLLLL